MSKAQAHITKTKPGKAAAREIDGRIEQLATVIGSKRFTKSEIRRYCKVQWNVEWRQADRYWTRARELLCKLADRSKMEFKSDALALYEGIIKSPKTKVRDKIAAQAEINAIIGLYAPRGYRVGDEQGKPLAAAVIQPIVNFIMPDNHRQATDGDCAANHSQAGRNGV
jgi:hypothetical protein